MVYTAESASSVWQGREEVNALANSIEVCRPRIRVHLDLRSYSNLSFLGHEQKIHSSSDKKKI
jgi:hypothetical protein